MKIEDTPFAMKLDRTKFPRGAQFVTEYSYADLKRDVERQPLLIPIDPMHLESEGECGVGGTDTTIRCGARANSQPGD